MDRLGQPLPEGVDRDLLVAAQHGRRHRQVHRGDGRRNRVERFGQSRHRRVQLREEVVVTLEQRARGSAERLAQQRLDAALLHPDVAQRGEVGEAVDLGQGEGGAVDTPGRRAGHDVDPGCAPGEAQQVCVGPRSPASLDEAVELEGDPTHPDGERDPAVHDDAEADLLPGHAGLVVLTETVRTGLDDHGSLLPLGTETAEVLRHQRPRSPWHRPSSDHPPVRSGRGPR